MCRPNNRLAHLHDHPDPNGDDHLRGQPERSIDHVDALQAHIRWRVLDDPHHRARRADWFDHLALLEEDLDG